MTTTLTRRDSTDVAAAPFGAGRRGSGPRVTTGFGDPDRRPVRRTRRCAWTATRAVAAIAVVAGMTVFAGIELGAPDGSGLVQPADMRVAAWFSAHRALVITPVLRLLNFVGSTVPIVVLAAVFGAWLCRRTSRGAFWSSPSPQSGLRTSFNSGYKMADTQGGAFEEGATVRPLVAGIATLGTRADGSVAVFAWGRDPKVDASMVSARQKPVGHKLSPDVPGDSNRYLTADQRDFVTVVSR